MPVQGEQRHCPLRWLLCTRTTGSLGSAAPFCNRKASKEDRTMVNFCCILGCSRRSSRDKGVSFYCIPTVLFHHGDHVAQLSKQRRENWIANIKREGWTPSKSSRVCSAHFVRGKPAYIHDVNNPDWAPTQNMGYSRGETEVAPQRHERLQQRKRKADDVATASILLELRGRCPEADLSDWERFAQPSGTDSQTELSFQDISSLEATIAQLVKDNIALRAQVRELKDQTEQTGLQEQDFKKW